MARVSRRMAIAAVVAGLTIGPVAAQSSVTGTYHVQGRNPDGSAYSGTARITENGAAIAMAWQVGSQSYSGTGTRHGQVVTVNWGDTHPVIYVIRPDGALHGTWSDGHALERLTR